MGKHINAVIDIIQKFEVPQEYHDALWEAYIVGSKQGFIEGGISVINEKVEELSL